MKQFTSLIVGLFFLIPSGRCQTGSNYTEAQAQEIVERHNFHRKEVGNAPLKWSNTVAAYAQDWADQLARKCDFEHRKGGKYGENIFWGSSNAYTPTEVIESFASEKAYWKGEKISRTNYQKFGHYTQMIWFSTTEVGCGYAVCKNGAVLVVCNYAPSGNYIGVSPLGNSTHKGEVKKFSFEKK